MIDIRTLAQRAEAGFTAHFGHKPQLLAYAPGRVNLIGEHTDYNDGFVLPCAIPFGTVVALERRPDGLIEAAALDLGDASDRFDTATRPARLDEGHWANHVRGIAQALVQAGLDTNGANIAIAGNVPQGAGLSSSASLGVALGLGLEALSGRADTDRTLLAKAAQWSEHHYVGCACGLMDQLASACCVEGNALLIDCRSNKGSPVPIPAGTAILIVHSGVQRGLVDSAYNERRMQCEAAARHFGVAALRDLDASSLEAGKAGLDPLSYRRARHVVSENARTLEAAEALKAGDLVEMGHLMRASHRSLRDDFAVTVPQVDALWDVMNAAIGATGGARMTGGGFGGCLVAVLPEDRVEQLQAAIRDHWRENGIDPQLLVAVDAASGAHLL